MSTYNSISSKIIRHHRRGCAALKEANKGTWLSPWATPTGKIHRLDTLGRKNGSGWRWIEFRCNDTDCPALVAIEEDSFLRWTEFGREKANP